MDAIFYPCLTYNIDEGLGQNHYNCPVVAYYPELLAVVFLTLAFYRLSSFGFQCGRTRRFFQYAGAAVVLSLASLADGGGISMLLFYAGGALSLWGWMLQRLSAPDSPQA